MDPMPPAGLYCGQGLKQVIDVVAVQNDLARTGKTLGADIDHVQIEGGSGEW